MDLAHAGDARLFIVERQGIIRILQPDGLLDPTPFLNITSIVNDVGGEQGLLGLVFHPQYGTNGFFYVYYCGGTGNGFTRVSRFHVTTDPDVADPGSELPLWTLNQPYDNHKGGDIDFGPDGYLYFAPGDGGSSGDPQNRAQNMALGFGKVLRIDVNSGLPYSIPPTNPFPNAGTDTLPEIFASGLRNPYRFTHDALTGDLWIGDVGQNLWEEIDFLPANDHTGPNFGWRCYEGNAPYNTAGCAVAAAYRFPVQVHSQGNGFCSVIAGRVYRGSLYPSLQGRFIYTDYCEGGIYSIRPNGGGGWIQETLMAGGDFGYACIGNNVNHELFICNVESGEIFRIVDPAAQVTISPKLFLEGPFNSGTMLMNDALRTAGLIPSTEPYTSLNFMQAGNGGGEVLGTGVSGITGNNAIVDWVRIELRSAAFPQLVVASRQALVQRDGDIVMANGNSPVTLGVGPGSYYVAVRHRNHLGAMTASPITLGASPVTVDFRSSALATYGTAARKTIGSQRALYTGNVLLDEQLKYTGSGNDRDPILGAIGGVIPTNSVNGYRMEDLNMDGAVLYTGSGNDRDPILVNIGGVIPTNTRAEQLP